MAKKYGRMAKLNRIGEYLQKAGYPKGRWVEFSRLSKLPLWRLSRILNENQKPTLEDIYKITDALERKFQKKLDPRDIFSP